MFHLSCDQACYLLPGEPPIRRSGRLFAPLSPASLTQVGEAVLQTDQQATSPWERLFGPSLLNIHKLRPKTVIFRGRNFGKLQLYPKPIDAMLFALENDQEFLDLQVEMVRLQNSIRKTGKRLLIIFEGRDAAGKGSTIMRFVRFLNPRHYRIVALAKPTEQEAGQWYFQRYIKELPNPGQIVFFDRSWYNRAVVEPVMGFCTEKEYKFFLQQVVLLERMLKEDGLHMIKFWFSIDEKEQAKRMIERQTNPLKQWKLSTVDALAQAKWDEYTSHKEAMFERTSTTDSPWLVIDGNDRDKACLESMRYVLNKMKYEDKGLTGQRLEPDPSIATMQPTFKIPKNKFTSASDTST